MQYQVFIFSPHEKYQQQDGQNEASRYGPE